MSPPSPTAPPARRGAIPGWAPALLLLILIRLARPGGYIGGGGDDWYYLEAARCIAHQGLCVPTTHWASRIPVVGPIGGVLALAGESAWTVAIVPLAYAAASIVLLAANVARRFGRPAAMLATVALVLTPAFAGPALQPNVDTAELAWTLAAILALQVAVARGAGWAAAAAGLLMAIAVLTRTSALALLPLLGIGWLLLPARARWLAVPFAAAMAAGFAIDAGWSWCTAGNPAQGWLLALHHGAIASTELAAGVDTRRGALLNLDFIRGWRRSMGIEVHWTVDPLLNLLADPACGLTWIVALLFAGAMRIATRPLARPTRFWLILTSGAAAAHFLILVFVLAIDPKPRMFLFEDAAAATVIGVLGVHGWRHGPRGIAVLLIALLAGRAGIAAHDAPDWRAATALAARWVADAPPGLRVDEWTRRSLTLAPAVTALPPERADAPLLILTLDRCAAARAGRAVLRAHRFARSDGAPVAWLRARHVLFAMPPEPSLCLLAPAPISAPRDRAASPPSPAVR